MGLTSGRLLSVDAAVIPSTTYYDEVMADSPLAYYRLDDPSGTTMTDASGNSRNGTYVNSPTLGATSLLSGDSNAAVTFDGSNDYCTVTDAAWMDVTTITLEAVIKLNATGAYQSIWDRDNGGSDRMWQLRISNTNKLEFGYWLSGSGPFFFAGATSLSSGTTYHVAATYDGTTGTVYLNGTSDGTNSNTGSLKTGAMKLVIGSSESGGGGTPSVQRFNGTIDEAAIYGSALSGTRIGVHAANV